MNAENVEKKAVIKRESKNRIRADFDRSPLADRLKAKFLSFYFLTKIAWWIFRMVLMVGISYVVLYPFFSKIAGSFMAAEDFVDVTVRLIPKHFTLDTYRAILEELSYWEAFKNTFLISFSAAVVQTFICSLIGYGFAKFKFRGRNIIFMLVMLTMIIPHQTIEAALYHEFAHFDILGIVRLLKGGGIQIFGFNVKSLSPSIAAFFEKLNVLPDQIQFWAYTTARGYNDYRISMAVGVEGITMINTFFPLLIMSLTGLAFKNALYIFLLRQFFRGIPDELEESAYMDGSGTLRTFIQIILPLSIPMMMTVFLFSFCWQWTDTFYTTKLMGTMSQLGGKIPLLSQIVSVPDSLNKDYAGKSYFEAAIRNTCGLMIIFPLVILYLFCQNFLVQGIEHSGIAN